MDLDHADKEFMRMALELAARGRGLVSPNPMVRAVVVERQPEFWARAITKRPAGAMPRSMPWRKQKEKRRGNRLCESRALLPFWPESALYQPLNCCGNYPGGGGSDGSESQG